MEQTAEQTDKRTERLLRSHGLRKTAVRKETLSVFYHAEHALTHRDLEEKLQGRFDRVTVYRTLHAFEEKGLVHKVIDDADVVKYALCGHECDESHHADNHVHFKCRACSHTFCLEKSQVPPLNLPDGFETESVELLVIGLCQNCR